jgi:hypothetical protein
MTNTSQLFDESYTYHYEYAPKQRYKMDGARDHTRHTLNRLCKRTTPQMDHLKPSLSTPAFMELADVKPEQNIRSTTGRILEEAYDISSKRKLQSIETVECKSDISLDYITRDEVVRKLSTCLSFYGNFVIIPALKETLDNIERMDNAKFSYWHEVMTFIDSYDLPYVSESRKKLVDELVAKITEYVQNEGLSANDWQKIICTLPDDVGSKFDHRLDNAIMEEVTTLAKQDRLPFNLSKPIAQLLKSAKKRAGKYIRNN